MSDELRVSMQIGILLNVMNCNIQERRGTSYCLIRSYRPQNFIRDGFERSRLEMLI